MGSDEAIKASILTYLCFNPRSRVGSDSIKFDALPKNVRFNPRSRVGSDGLSKSIHHHLSGFNPRSRVGSDNREICDPLLLDMFQSTLPRGERLAFGIIDSMPTMFQSTLPRGERLMNGLTQAMSVKFQSTLPRGERHLQIIGYLFAGSFNPRSRVGSD